jgi:hypothetical protein
MRRAARTNERWYGGRGTAEWNPPGLNRALTRHSRDWDLWSVPADGSEPANVLLKRPHTQLPISASKFTRLPERTCGSCLGTASRLLFVSRGSMTQGCITQRTVAGIRVGRVGAWAVRATPSGLPEGWKHRGRIKGRRWLSCLVAGRPGAVLRLRGRGSKRPGRSGRFGRCPSTMGTYIVLQSRSAEFTMCHQMETGC